MDKAFLKKDWYGGLYAWSMHFQPFKSQLCNRVPFNNLPKAWGVLTKEIMLLEVP